MSDFRDRVFDATRAIPRGEVRTYGQIAEAAGSPGAYRAAANLLAPLDWDSDIPFWRVVLSDGRVNREDIEQEDPEGVARHRRTLAEEGVAFTDDGRVASLAGRSLSTSGGGKSSRSRPVREPSPCGRRGHETVAQTTCPDCTPRR